MDDQKGVRAASVEARKRLILEAAAHCFVEQGFHQTSIRDIAKQANISLGNLYNHFEGKSAVIAEIAMLEAEDLAGLIEDMQQSSSSYLGLERFIFSYFDLLSQPENTVLSTEIKAEAYRNEAIVRGYLDNHSKLVAAVDHLLVEGVQAGDFHKDFPDDMASMLLDMVSARAERVAFSTAYAKSKAKNALRYVLKSAVVR